MPTLNTPAGPLAYFDSAPGATEKPVVVVLHSSASASMQWRKFIGEIAPHYRVVAPDLIGYGATPMTESAPTMADEVAMIAALADTLPGAFHLVGHSYGGAVALEAARHLGGRVASLSLFEPVAFHLLRSHAAASAWAEINHVASRHIALTDAGDHEAAADAFIGYWAGPAAFVSMPAEMRGYIVSTMPKIAAEWRMVLSGRGTAAAYTALGCPMLLLSGEKSTLAARTVAEILRDTVPGVSWQSWPAVGHMGPVTHPGPVNAALAAFIARAELGRNGPSRYGIDRAGLGPAGLRPAGLGPAGLSPDAERKRGGPVVARKDEAASVDTEAAPVLRTARRR